MTAGRGLALRDTGRRLETARAKGEDFWVDRITPTTLLIADFLEFSTLREREREREGV